METREVKTGKTASQQDLAALVARAMRYGGEVLIYHGSMKINAKSLMGMLSLPTKEGTALTLMVKGEGAKEAADGLARFIAAGYAD